MAITISVTSDDAKYPAVLAIIGGAAAPTAGQTIVPGQSLTDPSGAVWSFGDGNIILKNGAQFGGGVGTELGLFGGSIYVVGTGGAIYQATATGWQASASNPFAAATGAPSGGTTPTAFVESPCPSTIMATDGPNGTPSGTITTADGTTFCIVVDAGAEFYDVVVDGNAHWQASQGWYLPVTQADGSIDKEVWFYNFGDKATFVWRGGDFVIQPALPPIPNNTFLIPPPKASQTPGGGSGGTTTPPPTPVTATATGLSAAVHAAASGATIPLTAGVYTETTPINVPLTLVGAGIGTTTINITGIEPNQDKAALVPGVPGVVIEGLSITGAAISSGLGGNAAGVRDGAAGVGFALKNVEVYGCQDGLLTFASPISLDTCHIHDNGNPGNGAGTHSCYFGGGTVSIVNSIIEHCTHEHEVKSRATDTTITGSTVTTGGNGNCADICDCGNLTVSDTTFAIGKASNPSNQNEVALHYGEESTNNPGRAVSFANFVMDTTAIPGVSALFIFAVPDAVLTLTGCTYKGDTAPTIQGLAPSQISGTFTKAA